MPPNLRRAHQALDRAVDRLYRRPGFASDRKRVEHLFMLHDEDVYAAGSHGYFKDPDGHLWEIAHNPFPWIGPAD